MGRNKPLSCEEAARILCSAAKKGVYHFVEILLPKIAEVLLLNYSDYDRCHLKMESRFVCLWIATKALDGDQQMLIESIQKACLNNQKEKKRAEVRKLFLQRSMQYDDAWNNNSGGNQSQLCINILAEMFTGGNHQRELVNFWVYIQITNFVLSLMKAIVDLRKSIEIEE